jgi:type IV fimbrial biogenesis protein FimT
MYRADGRSSVCGFTLIEMLTVVALSATMLAMGLPSFNGLIERYRVNAKADALRASLNFARAEAIRRGAEVTLASRGATCDLTTSPTEWTCGWDVQVGSGTDAERLKSEGPDEKLVVRGTRGAITFDAFGRSSQWGCIDVVPKPAEGRSPNTAKLILSLGGLLRKETGGTCA